MISAKEANKISNGLEAILEEIDSNIKSAAKKGKFSIRYYIGNISSEREIALADEFERKGYDVLKLENNVIEIKWEEI